MPIARTLSCWSVIGVFVVITAGCYPTEPQEIQASSVPSASAKAPTPLAQSTYNQATPDRQPVPEASNCKSPQTQAEINSCASLFAKGADKRLNQVYQKLSSKLKGSQQEQLLIDSEQAWIKFRDTNCVFEQSRYEGGSIAPSIYSSCLEQVTKQRTKELEGYLEQM
jgi:uncharacterized protein YecT (DUF1311 family)